MIGVLESALGPRLLEAYHYGDKGALAALAARTNLGFLLIGGGGITFIFLTVQAVLDLTHSHATLILPIVAWILLSHCGPVILGASGLLMEVTRMQRQRSWVLGLWTPIALGSILLVNPDTPIELAKHVALLHLGYSAHLAVVLGMRHGVWPGITALLQKELKLT